MTAWVPFVAGAVALGAVVLGLLATRLRVWPDSRAPVPLIALLLAAAAVGVLATVVRLAAGPGPAVDLLWVAGALVLLPSALVLYPDGRPPAGLGWAAVAVVAASGGLGLIYPDPYATSGLSPLVAYLLVLAAQWWRYEHAGRDTRRALQWLVLGAVPGPLAAALASFVLAPVPMSALTTIVAVLGVAALALGLVARDARDVRALTLGVSVHAVTMLLVLSVFTGVVATIDAAAGRPVQLPPGALGAVAAVCALGYGPLARLLRQVIEVLLFGARSDPIEAASLAGERLGDDPVPALRSLRESLSLPYAALLDGNGEPVAVSGQPPEAAAAGGPTQVRPGAQSEPSRPLESVVRRPLSPADAALGYLEVGLRPGQLTLLRGDEQVLAVLAPALAQLMHARRLRAELQASRAAVVAGIEEERRRLRRDLHDGIGPRLTGVAYAADAARNVLARDPERAAELIAGVRAEAGEAIVEVRRLVEGLRPPSLDQMGLEQTVRQHARHLLRADGGPLTVDVRVAGPLPPLGAAVEVTAYRIVVEALTNAARHSGGRHATITMSNDQDTLTVEIQDDGTAPGPWVPGCGLTAMQERAEMLGGTLSAQPAEGGGVVSVRLPLTSSPVG